MKVLIASQEDVAVLLPMAECIQVMEDALRMLGRGEAIMPLRSRLSLPDGESIMGLMPAYLGGIQSVGLKVITVFPKNHGSEYDAHQGVVLLFDTEHGLLRAIVDATTITAIRTAAVSGVATRLLARPDAAVLALIGAGTQARSHLEAMRCVRDIRQVRVFSYPVEGSYRFAEREAQRYGLRIEAKESAQEAVEGADIVCTVTTSPTPVVLGEWLAPGTHINAVGAFNPNTRELDSAAVAAARLYVDRREATLQEAGEFLIPKSEGLIDEAHIVGELSEVLLGTAPGRRSEREITLFKSLGIAIEDLAAARHILDKATERGLGTWVEIGGRHYGTA